MTSPSPASARRIREVMSQIGREPFLPPGQRRLAGHDYPLHIGHGQTNSQPSTVVNMIDLLEVPVGAKVLDVGAGSGWTTAILAKLVGHTGRVIGVERIPSLAAGAAEAVASCNVPWAEVRTSIPGILGLPDEAPFDRILVSAEPLTMPAELVDQLGPGGIMVIPVAGVMHRVRKDSAGRPCITQHGFYAFVPLITDE